MNSEFKVTFLGESGTGAKTSLISRMVGDTFNDNCLPTTAANYVSKSIQNYLGNEVHLSLWDTAGQEKYRELAKIFIKDSHCVVLGYDITRKETLDEIREYHYPKIKEMLGDFPIIYLVANKIDLYEIEEVSEKEAKSFAEEKNMKFFEVSAKTGVGIDILLEDMVNSITNKFIIGKKEIKEEAKEEAKEDIKEEINSLKKEKTKSKNNNNIFHKFIKKIFKK